jgi:hypothetical protein
MSDDNEGVISITKPVILTFPNLDEARAVKGPNGKPSGEPKFSANFEIEADHEDLAALKARAVAVAKAKWPGRDLKELAFPFSSGDKLADKAAAKKKDREFSRGKAVLVSRSKFQPNLSVVEGGKIVEIDGNDKGKVKKLFYSGVRVLAQFNFTAYDGVGANPDGVTAYLNKVLSLNQGTRLTGGASSAEVFKDYIGAATDYDPTEGLDDEIPF